MAKAAAIISGGVAGFMYGGIPGAIIGAGLSFAVSQAQEMATGERDDAALEAARERQKQQALSNAQQEIARRRAIRQSIAEERVQRSLIESRTFGGGGPEGVGQSITGDTASAIGAARTQAAAAFGISRSQTRQRAFEIEAQSLNRFDEIAAGLGVLQTGLQAFGGNLQGINFGGSTATTSTVPAGPGAGRIPQGA